MHNFLSSTKKKNTIDKYFQKDKQNGTALMSLQNEKIQSTFNIESVQVKVEHPSKPYDLDTVSVVKTVSPTACGKIKEVYDPVNLSLKLVVLFPSVDATLILLGSET